MWSAAATAAADNDGDVFFFDNIRSHNAEGIKTMVSFCRAGYGPKLRIKMVEDFFIDLDYARTQVALLKKLSSPDYARPFFVSSVQPLEFKGLFTWKWEPQVGVLTRGVSPCLS